jgi:hypothetical protein
MVRPTGDRVVTAQTASPPHSPFGLAGGGIVRAHAKISLSLGDLFGGEGAVLSFPIRPELGQRLGPNLPGPSGLAAGSRAG